MIGSNDEERTMGSTTTGADGDGADDVGQRAGTASHTCRPRPGS